MEVLRRVKCGGRTAELSTFLIVEVPHVVVALPVNFADVLKLEPVQSLALLPDPILLFLLLRVSENTQSMLLSSVPIAEVLPTVRPEVVSISCFFVF